MKIQFTRNGALIHTKVDTELRYADFFKTRSSFFRISNTFSENEGSQAYSFSTFMPLRISFINLMRESLYCICSTWVISKHRRQSVTRMTRTEISTCCLTAVMVLGLLLKTMQKVIKEIQAVINKLTVQVCTFKETKTPRKWLKSRV